MDYGQAAYFEGNACQHVADWREAKRLEGRRLVAVAHEGRRMAERRMRARTGAPERRNVGGTN